MSRKQTTIIIALGILCIYNIAFVNLNKTLAQSVVEENTTSEAGVSEITPTEQIIPIYTFTSAATAESYTIDSSLLTSTPIPPSETNSGITVSPTQTINIVTSTPSPSLTLSTFTPTHTETATATLAASVTPTGTLTNTPSSTATEDPNSSRFKLEL